MPCKAKTFSKWLTQKKLSFSTTTKIRAISAKIFWIGPWLNRID